MSLTSKVLAGLLVLATVFGVIQSVRLDNAQDFHAEYVAQNRENLIAAYSERNLERNNTELALAEQAVQYNKGVRDAEVLYVTTIDNLNADNKQLRKHWQEALRRAGTASPAPAAGSPNGEATTVSEDVAGFVRDAAKSDATIVSLQDTVNNYLCQVNKEPFPGYTCKQ